MKKILFAAALLLFGIKSMMACMQGSRTVCEAYSEADVVVVGKVNLLAGDSNSTQKVKIRVEKNYKGSEKTEIIFTEDYSNCFWDFSKDEGKSILLFLTYDKEAKNYNFLLGIGGDIKETNEDLYWLDKLPGALSRTRISGTISHYEGSGYDFRLVDFLAGTKVKIIGNKKTYELSTDRNGVYELWDVPVGNYKIVPEFPGDFELDFPLPKGEVDYKQISEVEYDPQEFKVEIKPNGCGGSDYVVNKIKK